MRVAGQILQQTAVFRERAHEVNVFIAREGAKKGQNAGVIQRSPCFSFPLEPLWDRYQLLGDVHQARYALLSYQGSYFR